VPLSGKFSELRSRLFSAINAAISSNAKMLSVAFPRLPLVSFENLTLAPNSGLKFFFENAEKKIAVAAFSSKKISELTFPPTDFQDLENLFLKNRETFSLEKSDEESVPAPKIFVIGNFENSEKNSAELPVWQISREENFSKISAHVVLDLAPAEKIADALTEEFLHLKKITETPFAPEPAPKVLPSGEVGDDWYFSRGATDALKKIATGEIQKIVLARAKDFSISNEEKFPAGTFLDSLRERFLSSACTIFFAKNDAGTSVAGSSPETLAQLFGTHFETEALAGTAATSALAEDFLHDEKERREHRFVVDFIEEKLRKLGLFPQFPSEPETLVLPNVVHLRTPISAEIPLKKLGGNEKKIRLGEIVAALHPTPAMCGVPAESARQFIAKTEPFPRGVFSAPIGFVDANGDGFFAVAIRCAIFSGKTIRLFAGSGLVRGSHVESEAHEIDVKISALRSILVS